MDERVFGPGYQEVCEVGDRVFIFEPFKRSEEAIIIDRELQPKEPEKGVFSYYIYTVMFISSGRTGLATSGEVRKKKED